MGVRVPGGGAGAGAMGGKTRGKEGGGGEVPTPVTAATVAMRDTAG